MQRHRRHRWQHQSAASYSSAPGPGGSAAHAVRFPRSATVTIGPAVTPSTSPDLISAAAVPLPQVLAGGRRWQPEFGGMADGDS
jgi:hypothetical protein